MFSNIFYLIINSEAGPGKMDLTKVLYVLQIRSGLSSIQQYNNGEDPAVLVYTYTDNSHMDTDRNHNTP